jgi:hypothetical protein
MPENQNPVFSDESTITGDGTEEHPLTGLGVTSINGLKGAVTLESLDGSISIAEIGNAINIEASIGTPSKFLSYPQGLPSSAIVTFNPAGSAGGFAGNVILMASIFIPIAIAFNKLLIHITTGDATGTDHYDFGIYDLAGNLLADIGAQAITTTGQKQFAIAQGTVTLKPGMYWFAFTGNVAGGITLDGYDTLAVEPFGIFASLVGTPTWFHSATASVGGALPATATPPAPVAATNLGESGAIVGTDVRPTFALTSY